MSNPVACYFRALIASAAIMREPLRVGMENIGFCRVECSIQEASSYNGSAELLSVWGDLLAEFQGFTQLNRLHSWTLFGPLGSKVLARTACIVGGLAIPAYSSFRAIESKDTAEQEQWLFYWTVYGCLSAGEVLSDRLLSWLPGYYHAKLAFLMWLQLPLKNGSRQLISKYFRPPLLRYHCLLDGVVHGVQSDINNFLVAYLQELKFIKAVVRKLAQYLLAPEKSVKSLPKYIDDEAGSDIIHV
ncbi:hypothetical protein GOP47_0001333 [Adiantum capillus-veneris]|uniref:HVA22-like protein n=1 Tax=Adiantum capillus-veneris TaxID=13818 RepID=A0A9D4V8V4_ADICA|nr:hypothetical protein GOP47_0001333 [Adiantum capillus-veneris]